MSIVLFGAIFVDIKGYPINTFIPKGRNAGRVEQTFGGVTRNVAADIANMGLGSTFVSIVDDSATGEEAVRDLDRQNIDTRYIRKVKNGSGIWLAVFDETGDVQASISRRPDLMPILDILRDHDDEIFASADSIALEIDIEESIAEEIFRLAEKHHKQINALVSNMSIAMARRHLIQKLNCFICNREEAELFFSRSLKDLDIEDLRETLSQCVVAAGINKMVVTLGEQGAIYADRDGCHGFVPAIRTDVIDTTGAGDAFFAGTAAGLTYGKTLEESCAIGARVASSVIATTESVCPKYRAEELGFASR